MVSAPRKDVPGAAAFDGQWRLHVMVGGGDRALALSLYRSLLRAASDFGGDSSAVVKASFRANQHSSIDRREAMFF